MPAWDDANRFHLQCDLSKSIYHLVKIYYPKRLRILLFTRPYFFDRILNGTGPPNDNIYALTLLLNQNSDLELETVVFTPWGGITSTPSPQSWVAKDSFN